jgi:prolyl 4-hydroxylase
MKIEFNTEWKNWIEHNLVEGCEKYDIFDTLLKNGFAMSSVSDELEILKGAEKLDTEGAEIFAVDNFLTKEECEHLISLIKSKSKPSKTTNEETTAADYRTSRTCDLGRMEDEIVNNIDNRISSYIGIDRKHGEVIQGQWYKVGEQFKRHTDFFDPAEVEDWKKYAEPYGNRTWTFMICLNVVEQGGYTYFHEFDMSLSPVQGKAIIWKNLTDDEKGNSKTLHSGMPVEKGEKFIITKWFRQGQY